MYKIIASTIFTKGLGAFGSFIIVFMTSRLIGVEGRGEISLFIANLALVQLFNNIITGPALIYLIPRHKIFHIFIISFAWSILSSIFIIFLLSHTTFIDNYSIIDLLYLSVIFSILTSSMMIIQGNLEIKTYNLISLTQIAILIISLYSFIFFLNDRTIQSYIHALYISYIISLIISLTAIRKHFHSIRLSEILNELNAIFKIGFSAQISNFLNFINTRVSYYIISLLYIDKSSLGKFSLATALIESVWLISYGIATIQYPEISRSTDEQKNITLSLNYSKLTFWGSLIMILLLISIPENGYLYIFGSDFKGIKKIIILLSPGILLMSISKIFWNYFSGIGKFKYNNISGLIGLICSTLTTYFLIKKYGIEGAAYSTTLAYCLSSFYLIFMFNKLSRTNFASLLPSFNDYKIIKK